MIAQVMASSDLNLRKDPMPNPDMLELESFLKLNRFLVKLTDKNLGISVVEKNWYLEQCEKMLSDSSVYETISRDELVQDFQLEVFKRIEDLCSEDESKSVVFGSSKDYLLASLDDTAIPTFHGLPKVHKDKWSLRPIIPSHSWCTRRASELADFVLRQAVKDYLPWCVESTKEVVSKLQCHTFLRADDIWIVTGDVQSFYTNVPIDSTSQKLGKLMGNRELEGIRTSRIKDLLDIVMYVNCFEFNGKYYRQVEGVAMGTSCAPAFANLSLGLLEMSTSIVDKIGPVGLQFYARYIDDIQLIWKGSRQSLEEWLVDFAPKLEPYKLSWEIHNSSQPAQFLDMELFWERGFGALGLQTRVFRKRMNKHQYIPWSSAHPIQVKRAFVKAELTRFAIICSQETYFDEKVSLFFAALRRRGYPSTTLIQWKKTVDYNQRPLLIESTKKLARGLPLMLPSSYDDVWEYIDGQDVLQTMKKFWLRAGPLPAALERPLIKSLRRTENMFDKFSAWNKAILQPQLSLSGRMEVS
ncbi:hypothetical protein TWF694_011915 [Orbilia ellipsospora]